MVAGGFRRAILRAPPGFGDAWADPRGTFLSGKLASPAWELLGWKGQVVPADTVFTSGQDESIGGTPPFNVAFVEGTVGWRRQIESHTPVPNWPTFTAFDARYLNDNRPVIAADQTFAIDQGSRNVIATIAASDPDAGDGKRPSKDVEVKISIPDKLTLCGKVREGSVTKYWAARVPKAAAPGYLAQGFTLGACPAS
jgi:hypothetical protein